ncbi:hypothetical protein BDF19DRAFT_420215 [Syncephalis fuscata]|nr:hypothetical protein BDF19DRAFT_420215 [Syncephalis fuscata]
MEPRCPVCQAPLIAALIHFEERFTMCSNTECPFPFKEDDINLFIASTKSSTPKSKGKRK